MAHALAHLELPAAGHERSCALEVQIVEAREPQAPDLQEVAKAGRREQPGAGAAALEDGIGGHGRAMDDLRHRARPEARLGEQRGGTLATAAAGAWSVSGLASTAWTRAGRKRSSASTWMTAD
jgi:hypothetical protein